MKTIWGAVLLAMMMLATAALAADLDTPKVGAAVCAPEEEEISAVLRKRRVLAAVDRVRVGDDAAAGGRTGGAKR